MTDKSTAPKYQSKQLPLDAYKQSQATRKETRETKKLGFQRPSRTRPRRKKLNEKNGVMFGNRSASIATKKIRNLSDTEYDLICRKLELMPEDRKLEIPRDHKSCLKDILGETLAYELMKLSPDMDVVNIEARYIIPDKVAEAIKKKSGGVQRG